MKSITVLSSVVALGFLSVTTAHADAVTEWNEITMTAVIAGRPGPQGSLDTALVQIAVHDAVQAIEHRFEPYHAEVKGAKGSRSAAVAAAAHGVLVGMYPTQVASLNASFDNYVSTNGLTGDPGLIVGKKVAEQILPLRRLAPATVVPFDGGPVWTPGRWRPTDSLQGTPPAPAPFSPMVTPWMANSDPYTLSAPNRFRADPPPALTSERYTKDYEEVKQYGALLNSKRTPEQTDLAHFYNENIFSQWNRALRGIADKNLERIGDRARLFALANMAVADTVISAWDTKKHYAMWRPITAIREGDTDGNSNTIGDPNWQPLVNTPNYPDYTSGVNVVTGAMTRTLSLFFMRDRMTFDVTSVNPLVTKKTRTYYRFSDAVRDTVEARIYLGIHFRFADTAGRTQGAQVAEYVFDHALLPNYDRFFHGLNDGDAWR